MRDYCAEAIIYGDKIQPAHLPFPKIIVILNPVADKKSASDTVSVWILLMNYKAKTLLTTHKSPFTLFSLNNTVHQF